MSLVTTPRTWAAGEVVTATYMNTEVRDAFAGIQSAWTSYTPTWTNLTVGNGTVAAYYMRVGKTIHARCRIVWGSTTSATSAIGASLPVTPSSAYNLYDAVGVGTLMNGPTAGSTDRYACTAALLSTSSVYLIQGNSAVTNAVPFTFASSDVWTFNVTYEAA